MIYSEQIQKAIRFATKVHQGQRRKGKDVPYVTHPLTVGLILARVTEDENIIAAGILHDTIEDCKPYGSVTEELLEKMFNSDVARMVSDVTEQDKTNPWMERKMAALLHIKSMEHDSLLVKTADVLHNLKELNDDIAEKGDSAFDSFNASKPETITRYQKLLFELEKAWSDNPLLNDLKEALKYNQELIKL